VSDAGTPLAVNDGTYIVDEDSTINRLDWSGNDTLIDGATLSSFETTTSNGGTVVDNLDGTFNYVPAAGYVGTDSFEYTICDNDTPIPTCSSARIDVDVQNVNDAPVATDDSFSGVEEATITGNIITGSNGNGVDSDLDMDTLEVSQFIIGGTVYSIISGSDTSVVIPNVGTITIGSDGSLTFVPVADYNGSVPTITYTLTDGLLTDTADVTITVTPVNDAPIADINSTTTTEDIPVTFNVTSTDTDTDGTIDSSTVDLNPTTLAIDNSITTAEGTWEVASNGDVTFTPVLGYVGDATLTYTVEDNDGLTSNEANLRVTVIDEGNPLAVNNTVTTTEDIPVTTIDVTLNDSMDDNATINSGNPVSSEGVTVINNNDGTFTYTPPTGFVGTDTFTYTICDDDVPIASCSTATVTVTVEDEGDPITENDSASTTEDVPVTTGNVLDNDSVVDNATITSFDTASTEGGTVTSNGDGTFEYTPAIGFAGIDTFTYTICDDDVPIASCSTAIVTITVTDDIYPTAVDDNVSITEDTTVATVINALSNDTLSDDATYSTGSFVYTGANGATIIDNNDGTFDYTPAVGFVGLDSFSYTICDDDTPIATCSTATVFVNVTDEGNPVAVNDTASTIEDTLVTTVNVLDNDNTLDNVTITDFDTISTNGGILVSNGDGTFDYTPATGFAGVDTFTYTICDDDLPTASCSTGTVSVTVSDAGTPLAVNDGTYIVDEDSTINRLDWSGNDTLIDGATLSSFETTTSNGGTVVDNLDGTFNYVPAAGYVGTDSFEYTICDNDTPIPTCSSARIDVDVQNVNDAPVATDDSFSGVEEATITGNIITGSNGNGVDSDLDMDTLEVSQFIIGGTVYSIISGSDTSVVIPNVGTITIGSDGSLTFVPVADYNGSVPTITYTLTDGLLTDTADVTITVTPVNDAPIADINSTTTTEDIPVTFNVTSTDTDTDGTIDSSTVDLNPTTLAIDNSITTAEGTWEVASNGDVTFTPVLGYVGDATLTYTVEDNDGLTSNEANLRVTVIDEGNPLAVNNTVTTTEDIPVTTIDVTLNDSMDDNATINSGNPVSSEGVTVINNNDGTFTYTPPTGFVGTDTFTYTICDDDVPIASCSTATVTVTVEDEGDPITENDSASTTEDVPVTTGNVLDNDSVVDNATITSFDTASTEGGTVTSNGDGTFEYTPAIGFAGIDTFTYTICDDDVPIASCSTAIVTITVTDDIYPTAVDDNVSITEDTTVATVINALSNDTLSDDATYSTGSFVYTGANGATIIDNNDGTFDYTPAVGFAGLDSFSYTICDDDTPIATCSTATVFVNVTDEGNPVAVVDNETTEMNIGFTTANVLDNDNTLDNVTITNFDTISTNGGILVSNGDGTFDYTPALNFIGIDSFNYTICDDDTPIANCSTTQILINVLSGDSDLVTTKTVSNPIPNEGEIVTYILTVANNGPSTATGVSLTDNLPVGLTYVNHSTAEGTFNNGSGVWDIGNLTNGAVATLTIDARVNIGTSGDEITNIATSAEGDQFDPNPTGNIQVELIVNQSPLAIDDSSIGNVTNSPVFVDVLGNDNDPEGLLDPTTVQIVGTTNPEEDLAVSGEGTWSIDSTTGGITFTPEAGFTGDPTPISYTVEDTNGNVSNEATVTVGYAVEFPVAVNDLSTGNELGKPVSVNPLADNGYGADSDPDGILDPTTVSLIPLGTATSIVTDVNGDVTSFDVPGEGTWSVDSVTGVVTFIPIVEFITNPTPVSYTIEDNDGNESNSALIIIQMIPQADISVIKTDSSDGYVAGTTSVYVITVTNNGPSDATNVVVIDNVPSGLPASIVSWTGNGTSGTGDLNNTILVLESGESMVYTVNIDVPSYFTGQIINIASAFSDIEDPDLSNNTSTDTSEEGLLAALFVTKTVDNETPIVGEDVVFTITITNNGPSDATGINLVDKLPTGYTMNSLIPAVVDQGSYEAVSGLWTVGALDYLESTTMLITATVNNFGDYTNIAEIVSADQGDPNSIHGNNNPSENDQASAITVPVPVVDLRLTKTVVDDITSTEVGNQVTFEIRVYNDGAAMATGVQVTDLLPSGYDFVNYSSTIGTYNPLIGLWNIGFIEKDNTAVLLVDVIVLENGEYMNCAEITTANEMDVDSTPGNGDATEDDFGCASVTPNSEVDLSITKAVVADNVNPEVETEVTFEIRITNNGTVDANEVEVTDLLPSGYTFVNYSSTEGTYSEVTGLWNIGNILKGDTEILLIDVNVNAFGDYINCTSISNLHQTDPNLSNNSACLAITPIPVIDLELTKDVDDLEPVADTEVEFIIIVVNNGPSDATGVEVTDLLPSGYTFVNYIATTGNYAETTGIWNIGNITSNTSETLTITAIALTTGDWTNIAEITAANEFDIDSTPGNYDFYEDDRAQVTTEPIILLTIPEGFTPNGDGVNDVLGIQYLEVLYPNFSMEIVNRWGNIVYKYKHNGNPNKTPEWFDGTSNGRWNVGKGKLPVGTYFYTIYFNNNERKPEVGWIYLRR
ncbi:Ig-like domain-containing protein, partial [Lutibacter sp. B1]|uniref:Ig-like domain-containing protein n=1 Tax=Lutibacter sp. B1 TaxID=2725996 RepID=UPI001456CE93